MDKKHNTFSGVDISAWIVGFLLGIFWTSALYKVLGLQLRYPTVHGESFTALPALALTVATIVPTWKVTKVLLDGRLSAQMSENDRAAWTFFGGLVAWAFVAIMVELAFLDVSGKAATAVENLIQLGWAVVVWGVCSHRLRQPEGAAQSDAS